jgi:transcription elongation factor SPT5
MNSDEDISGLNDSLDESEDDVLLRKRSKKLKANLKNSEKNKKTRIKALKEEKLSSNKKNRSVHKPKQNPSSQDSDSMSGESNIFNKSDEDDEESDSESEETDQKYIPKSQRLRNKKRQSNVADYFDNEAEEENDEPEYQKSEKARKLEREKYQRRFRDDDIFSRLHKKSADELAQMYKQKAKDYEDSLVEDEEENAILPTHRDPRLFAVQCKKGFEREAAVSLIRKYFDLKNTPKEIFIFSANALDKIVGTIFVEALQEAHVREAIEGLMALNKDFIKLIPAKEVHSVFIPDPNNDCSVKIRDFVRIKRGLYKGDLAMVEKIDDDSNAVILKIVPRLGSNGTEVNEANLKNKVSPLPRLFNPDEYTEAKLLEKLHINKRIYMLKNQRFENGFLLKKFDFSHFDTQNLLPTFEEVKIFQDAESNPALREQILKNLSSAMDQNRKIHKNISKEDDVRVISGDLIGLVGKVLEIAEGAIKVDFSSTAGMNEPFTFHPSEVVKLFQVGDQVEILAGRHKGLSATVIKLMGNMAYLISEDHKDEIAILASDIKRGKANLKSTLKRSTRSNELSKNDLVALNDGKTVGVILSMSSDSITLLDTENYVSSHSRLKIQNKFPDFLNISNCYNQSVHSKCTVKVLNGVNKDTLALVMSVYKGKVFLFDRNKSYNSGIFAEDANNCYVLESQVYDYSRNSARFNNPVLRNYQKESADRIADSGQIVQKPRKVDIRVMLIGQQKKITKGEYIGYEGTIQSICDNKARFELSAINKVINIPLDYLNINMADKDALANETQFNTTNGTGKTSSNHFMSRNCVATPIYCPDN